MPFATVSLNPGEMFGEGGKCYMRMNVGCPRSIITTVLKQIREGVLGDK